MSLMVPFLAGFVSFRTFPVGASGRPGSRKGIYFSSYNPRFKQVP